MRRYLVPIAAALLLLTACSSDKTPTTSADSGSGGSSTGGLSVDPNDPEAQLAPGVSADTIKIGITFVDLKAVQGLTTNHGDYAATYQALVGDWNARGGVNGRKLQAIIAPVNPTQQASADEVCLKFTEDDKVFAVMGFFLADSARAHSRRTTPQSSAAR